MCFSEAVRELEDDSPCQEESGRYPRTVILAFM